MQKKRSSKGKLSLFLNKRHICIALMTALFISIIPLILIAPYDHPSADDFSYGAPAMRAMRETGSLTQTVSAAIDKTKSVYGTWQGTFVAVFFMSLQPTVFSYNLYMLSPVVLITGFILSNLLLFKIIFMDYFGADKYDFGIVSAVLIFLSVHFVFSPVQAFYWYNSAMYYTGFYILVQMLVSAVLKSFIAKSSRKIIYVAVSILLGFMIGGSNFVTALTSVSVMGVIFLHRVILKKGDWFLVLPGFMAVTVCLLISVTAPGNTVRQQAFADLNMSGMNPISAVFTSFIYAAQFILHPEIWKSAYLFAFIGITPCLYKIAKDSKQQFKMPLLVTAVFFCVYACTFTPNLYAMSSYGPARVVNVNVFALLVFLLLTLFYWCGWTASKVKMKSGATSAVLSAISFFLFVITCANGLQKDINGMTGVSALNSLITSEAQVYHHENLERLALYKDESIKNAEVKSFSVKPHVLFFDDITNDKNDARNIAVAESYGKESVRLAE